MTKHTFNQQAAQWDEIDKLREQNRRLRAAIRRVKKCPVHYMSDYSPRGWIKQDDVLAALKLRK
jgi:hypothetical protein